MIFCVGGDNCHNRHNISQKIAEYKSISNILIDQSIRGHTQGIKMFKDHCTHKFPKFLRSESGAATIETVLWLPFFVGIFGLIVDASLMFNAQAALTRTVQDANRAYSIGLLDSDSATEEFVLARVGAAKDDEDTVIQTSVSDGVITTVLSVQAGHYMAIGLFDAITNMNITVASQHLKES